MLKGGFLVPFLDSKIDDYVTLFWWAVTAGGAR